MAGVFIFGRVTLGCLNPDSENSLIYIDIEFLVNLDSAKINILLADT
jgi:hypothetical protein